MLKDKFYKFYKSGIYSTSGNIHTNGALKNNNDNNTIPIFKGLNKTTQKTWTLQGEGGTGKDKELCSHTNVF
jgi:hypothetical protein